MTKNHNHVYTNDGRDLGSPHSFVIYESHGKDLFDEEKRKQYREIKERLQREDSAAFSYLVSLDEHPALTESPDAIKVMLADELYLPEREFQLQKAMRDLRVLDTLLVEMAGFTRYPNAEEEFDLQTHRIRIMRGGN